MLITGANTGIGKDMAYQLAVRGDVGSPRNTSGIEALRDQPFLVRTIASKVVLPYIAPLFGAGHKLEVGAKRLVDTITDTTSPAGSSTAASRRSSSDRSSTRPRSSRTCVASPSRTMPTGPSTASSPEPDLSRTRLS